MGYKIYGEVESGRSRLGEFVANFFAGFVAFSCCIGGWLVGFGMDVGIMLGMSAGIALIGAGYLAFIEI